MGIESEPVADPNFHWNGHNWLWWDGQQWTELPAATTPEVTPVPAAASKYGRADIDAAAADEGLWQGLASG